MQAGAVPADLNARSAMKASSREDLMVEIRVAVDEDITVLGLMRRFAELFGRSAISFDHARKEVRVESEWESRAVSGVIGAVQAWIDEDDGREARLSIGERSYVVTGSRPLPAGR
jgi:hypothetical protein